MRSVRLAFAALAALLIAGCTVAPPPEGGLVPGAGGVGPMCMADSGPCSNTSQCCGGLACTPSGRLGSLCRRPYPSAG